MIVKACANFMQRRKGSQSRKYEIIQITILPLCSHIAGYLVIPDLPEEHAVVGVFL